MRVILGLLLVGWGKAMGGEEEVLLIVDRGEGMEGEGDFSCRKSAVIFNDMSIYPEHTILFSLFEKVLGSFESK